MFAYFILGLTLLVGLILLARWFINADPKVVVRAARWIAVALAVVVVLLLVFASRQAWFALLLPLLLPLLMRSGVLWRRIKAATGPTPGQTSEISTRYFRMTLDHDSGVMSGEILDGEYSGRRLEDLELGELIRLWRECHAEDRQSAAVLEAYLDRRLGDEWREAAGAGPGPESGEGATGGAGPGGAAMSRDEAYDILGLKAGASDSDIREAHRRMMQKVHPDHGGSNYLAAKINQAKELLLGE